MNKWRKSYFPHDENARNDQKLLKLRTKFENAKGYGLFWMFIEAMAESSTGKIDGSALAELELSFGIASSYLKTFVDYCVSIGLFSVDDNGHVFTKRMLEHKDFRAERSESGKRGAASRIMKYGQAQHKAQHHAENENSFKQVNEIKLNKLHSLGKPTIDEIQKYCDEKGYSIDAPYFFNYYETRGWMIGKNKIKSWKACVRTWVLRNRKEEPQLKLITDADIKAQQERFRKAGCA